MSDSGSVASQSDATRVKGVTIVKPIVYGSSSTPFGKKREPDGHTHEWTIYVKPHTNEDISAYVKFRFIRKSLNRKIQGERMLLTGRDCLSLTLTDINLQATKKVVLNYLHTEIVIF